MFDLEKILASCRTLVHMQAASPMFDVLNELSKTEAAAARTSLKFT